MSKVRLGQGKMNVKIDVTNTWEPYEAVAVDTIGPLPVDEDGNCYIIAIIDSFSRAVELVPAKDCTAKAAAKAILSILKYGCPQTITSDNGPQFAADLIRELLEFSTLIIDIPCRIGLRRTVSLKDQTKR